MRYQRIESLLREHFFDLELLQIEDESHMHAGRQGQESHFKILMVSPSFVGVSRVQRQRQVQTLLGQEFESGLHALSLRLLTPEEGEAAIHNFKSPSCQGRGSAGSN
jgi:BolA family transcriptional regulator, general stress-responsive regulator